MKGAPSFPPAKAPSLPFYPFILSGVKRTEEGKRKGGIRSCKGGGRKGGGIETEKKKRGKCDRIRSILLAEVKEARGSEKWDSSSFKSFLIRLPLSPRYFSHAAAADRFQSRKVCECRGTVAAAFPLPSPPSRPNSEFAAGEDRPPISPPPHEHV